MDFVIPVFRSHISEKSHTLETTNPYTYIKANKESTQTLFRQIGTTGMMPHIAWKEPVLIKGVILLAGWEHNFETEVGSEHIYIPHGSLEEKIAMPLISRLPATETQSKL